MSSLELLRIFEREPVLFKQRLAAWMQATVMAIEAACQSSVKALPRKFGHTNKELPSLPLSRTEQKICRYDGGSDECYGDQRGERHEDEGERYDDGGERPNDKSNGRYDDDERCGGDDGHDFPVR